MMKELHEHNCLLLALPRWTKNLNVSLEKVAFFSLNICLLVQFFSFKQKSIEISWNMKLHGPTEDLTNLFHLFLHLRERRYHIFHIDSAFRTFDDIFPSLSGVNKKKT